MPILFKHKKHIKTRFIPILLLITLFGASPILIEIIGAKIHEWTTGTPCEKGNNCATYGVTWFTMFTFAVAFFLYVGLAIISIIDYFLYRKKLQYLTNKKKTL